MKVQPLQCPTLIVYFHTTLTIEVNTFLRSIRQVPFDFVITYILNYRRYFTSNFLEE